MITDKTIDGFASKYIDDSCYPHTHCYDKIRSQIGGSRAYVASFVRDTHDAKLITILKIFEDDPVSFVIKLKEEDLNTFQELIQVSQHVLESYVEDHKEDRFIK